MRKLLILSSIVLLTLVTASPLIFAAPNDFDYIANPPRVQVSPDMNLPNGIPLCKSASLGNLVCYSPPFIKRAYNFPATLDGTGQTILIVDAFGSPSISADLSHFDSVFGIPDPRTLGGGTFTITCPTGPCPVFDPTDTHHNQIGWSIETSLDVEYAHAMAPNANIVLVVASTSSGNAINAAEAQVIPLYPGSVMSQSFGIPEYLIHGNNAQVMQAHKNYQKAQSLGITVLASAGDVGATNGIATANAGFPSSDPLVTAVGGTQGLPYNTTGTLVPCGNGQTCTSGLSTYEGPCALGRLTPPDCTPVGYGGEQVWNEPSFGSATGGAPSLLFGVPSYQNGLGLTSRTTPDVSYNAAIDGGVLVYDSTLGGTFIVGGTSAGSPQWAAIFALVNQARAAHSKGPLGFANTLLYTAVNHAADFHDITVGNNQLVGTPVGFSATAGWDDATGWGTPNVTNLISDLS